MLRRIWNTAKGALAIAALVAAALVSADRLDRRQAGQPVGSIFEPAVTGSVTPGPR